MHDEGRFARLDRIVRLAPRLVPLAPQPVATAAAKMARLWTRHLSKMHRVHQRARSQRAMVHAEHVRTFHHRAHLHEPLRFWRIAAITLARQLPCQPRPTKKVLQEPLGKVSGNVVVQAGSLEVIASEMPAGAACIDDAVVRIETVPDFRQTAFSCVLPRLHRHFSGNDNTTVQSLPTVSATSCRPSTSVGLRM